MTTNYYFAENVHDAREAGLKLQLEALNSWQTEGGGEPLLCLKDILGVVMSNDDYTIQESSPRISSARCRSTELHQIAGAEDETIRRRNMLETELGSLKAGEKILES
jgi:hypothetical protein